MFDSIRWRLVASYVLLTVITVSMIGVLAVSLARQYVEQQEKSYLTANAEAVARQAVPFMWPGPRQFELQELAETSSLLANTRVKILDARQRVLVDSGPYAQAQEFVWVVPHVELGAQVVGQGQSFIMVVSPDSPMVIPIERDGQLALYEQLSPGVRYMHVRRTETMWGSRLVFEARQSDQSPLAQAVAQGEAKAPAAEATPLPVRQVVSVPIGQDDLLGSQGDPLGYVELSAGPGFGVEALATMQRAFVLAGGGAALLAVVVGLLVSQGLTSPLRRLAAVAGRMSSGDLSARVVLHGQDEIGQLGGQFNTMAERLEASFAELAAERDALRRFIADASHELRTPITALKSFNELLQDGAADDPSIRVEFLSESHRQIGRLEWITHHLLDLSRLDAGLVDLDIADNDTGELIEATLAAFRAHAAEKGVRLELEYPAAPVLIHCDRPRTELALSNLVDNAIKFTPGGGRVVVGAAQVDERVHVWVRDTGPGVDQADAPHIFERFYRGRATGAEGSGLGLAIVQSIVQAQGGQVWVEAAPGGGSCFVMALPPGG